MFQMFHSPMFKSRLQKTVEPESPAPIDVAIIDLKRSADKLLMEYLNWRLAVDSAGT